MTAGTGAAGKYEEAMGTTIRFCTVKSFSSIKIRKHVLKVSVVLIWVLLSFVNASAQSVSAAIDRNKILIGEQVTLLLKAEDVDSRLYFVQSWFPAPDTGSHIQIVKASAIDTVDVNGLTTYQQRIIITSFDSGRWRLGPLKLKLQDRSTGKQTTLKTDSVVLNVLPVDVSGMQDYHDVKDIIPVNVPPDYTMYFGVALSIIILGLLIWFLLKNRRNKPAAAPLPAHKGTPLEYALSQIRELQKEDLPVKSFYTRLTDICRTYFAEQLHISSAQATSDELMVLLSVYLQQPQVRTEFYQLLRLGDAVKFARYQPEEAQTVEAIRTVIGSLQYIDALTQKKLEHAE